MQPLLFDPIYKERVWGGRNFQSRLGRNDIPPGVIGESWEIVDRTEDVSTVRSGVHSGSTLRELIRKFPETLMGNGWDPSRAFPVLVKWLDCQQRLSLQVHPPADKAESLGGEPKTENWFIADAEPDAALLVGLRKGVTREAFQLALQSGSAEKLVHRIPVNKGESIFIPSGRLHAIDAGNLILEIQQNSDTTYRVFDWGRVGLDGTPRQLHIDESMQSIQFDDFEPETIKPMSGKQILAQSEVFNLTKFTLEKGETLSLPEGQPRILSLISGIVVDSTNAMSFTAADNALIPAGTAVNLTADSASTLLVTDQFASLNPSSSPV